MNIFQSSDKRYFLQEVIDFTKKYSKNNLFNFKIILPNGLLCTNLQQLFIKNLNSSILPTIIPIGELNTDSEEIFKLPSKQINSITRLEEKIALAETIYSYTKLEYSLAQSLRLAPSLANLFFEFEANNIDLSELKNLPLIDEPKHWYQIYDFLNYSYITWQQKISNLNKLSRAKNQKIIFETELNKLKNNQQKFLLLAGINGNNLMINNFISNVARQKNAFIILPPSTEINIQDDYLPENALYLLQKLIKQLMPCKIINLGKSAPSLLDNLITPTKSNNLPQKIKYIEFENIFQEAEYIAIECTKNPSKKIAIIAHNQQTKEQYCHFLDKYNLNYHDIFGIDILKHPVISLLLLISENLCCQFNSKNLFTILSHPLINSESAQQLKNLIRDKNRLIIDFTDINNLITKYANDNNDLVKLYSKLKTNLSTVTKENNFHDIFCQSIKILEILIPDIWQKYENMSISLTEIVQNNWQININDVTDFPDILKQLLDGGRIIQPKQKSNITICKANESSLVNYDLTIITNCNENIYPIEALSNPWMNDSMQKKLNLDSMITNLGNSLYNFYLNMQNDNIILTRSKRQSSSKQTLASPFILHLMHIAGNQITKKNAHINMNEIINNKEETYAYSEIFPKRISATDIETLIKTPYNFYAKKILNLYKIEEINETPNLADFGNFFHKTIDEYTKNYQINSKNKEQTLINIANNILQTSNLPDNSKKSWLTKITAIALEFIDLDEQQRKTSKLTYSEVKGKITLNISGKEIDIIAIADRINIDHNNKATIIDYKTGVAPSKNDIFSGLAPQLIIESIILSEKGFNIENCHIDKISYIKINSSSPYIEEKTYNINLNDLSDHKNGLIKLLKYYIDNKKFIIKPNMLNYDNYQYLARRI